MHDVCSLNDLLYKYIICCVTGLPFKLTLLVIMADEIALYRYFYIFSLHSLKSNIEVIQLTSLLVCNQMLAMHVDSINNFMIYRTS